MNLLLDTHIAQIAERMEELKNLQGQMLELRSQGSQNQPAKDCGILHGLTRHNPEE